MHVDNYKGKLTITLVSIKAIVFISYLCSLKPMEVTFKMFFGLCNSANSKKIYNGTHHTIIVCILNREGVSVKNDFSSQSHSSWDREMHFGNKVIIVTTMMAVFHFILQEIHIKQVYLSRHECR